MSTPLHTCWLVGPLNYRNDVAAVVVARTKTAARQYAQRMLAKDEQRLGNAPEGAIEQIRTRYASHGKKHARLDVQAFAKWLAEQPVSDSCSARAYLRVTGGIWLTSPRGERVHVTDASQVARKGVQ